MEPLLRFLKNKTPKFCVLSTITSEQQSQSATVAYAVLDDLSLLFSTSKKSRKWRNIQENPHVSVVFGQGFEEYNVQYEGTAELITQDQAYEESDRVFFATNPQAEKFKTQETGFIKVTPRWIRVTDYTQQPLKIEEKRF